MNSSYNSDEHVCYFGAGRYPQGYDHPIPPEDPARLQGPALGEVMRYKPRRESYADPVGGNGLVRVMAQSYVWSPGECRAKGGYRHYDWTVIEWPALSFNGQVFWKTMVVDDADLVSPRL